MAPLVSTLDGHAALAHLGVIRARGDDAARFLHGQLTTDLLDLDAHHARWAGFCSAKGRLQVNFLALAPAPAEVLLICSADLLAATLKRLSMFVLRLRCGLSDASAEVPLHGAVGAAASTAAQGLAPLGVRHEGAQHVVRLPDVDGLPRALIIGPPQLSPAGSMIANDTWRWLEVRSALPWIEAATVDAFVPQMLNFELTGGVDFDKGCYPGQEVVARSQYRGTIKRRMFLFDTHAPLRAGDEVYSSADTAQPAGKVVNAAPAPAGGFSALIEIKLAALDAGTLHLGAAAGPLLVRVPMPYPIPVAEAA